MAYIESGKTFDKDENYEKLKTRMNNMDTKQYVLRIPADIFRSVKIKVAQEGKTFKQVLLDGLDLYLNK